MDKIHIVKENGKWLVNNKQYPNLLQAEKSFFEGFLRMMRIDFEKHKLQSQKA
jgi:hypothetical protein